MDFKNYKNYETLPEIVKKNKNNILYLKDQTPEDLKPLIDENTKNITTNTNNITKINELIQKAPEGTKIIVSSSDGTKQYTIEIDAKTDEIDFDGLKLESFVVDKIQYGASPASYETVSIDSGSSQVIKESNGIAKHFYENLETAEDMVVGEGLTLGGVRKTNWDTVSDAFFKDGVSIGTVNWSDKADKINYDGETGSKAILNATTGNEMEFKAGELAQPSLLLEQNGINMLNSQITKTVNSTADTHLVNKAEVKELIANAGIGEWKNIYDNGSLVPADDGEGNYYYVFNPDSSNLDQFTQSGEKDYVAVPRTDLYFSKELNKPFYDFSVVGDFSEFYGAGAGGIWLEDTLTITINEAEKFQNKEFIVYVKAKESGTNIIYNSKVLKLDFNYLMTFKNGYAELQLNEQINYQLEEYTSSTDTKPKISNGTWLTSDKDFRINKTDMLDVGSAEEVWENISFTVLQNDIRANVPSTQFSKIKITGEVKLGSDDNYCTVYKVIEPDKIPSRFYGVLGNNIISTWIGKLVIIKSKTETDNFIIEILGYKYNDSTSIGGITESSNLKIEGVRKTNKGVNNDYKNKK